MITEDQLEQLCLDWFREGSYEVIIKKTADSPGGLSRQAFMDFTATGRELKRILANNGTWW